MNFRKYGLALASLMVMIAWGILVVSFCYKYMSVLETLNDGVKFTMAKYGMLLSLILFHLTWAVATINQSLMAYAMSKDIGDSYVRRLNSDYKYPLMFTVVDVGYIIFFSIKFGEYFV